MSIVGCQFYTGDDSIAGRYWDNVLISDCIVNSSCNGIRLIGPATHLIVHDCLFYGPGVQPHRTSNRYNMLAGINLQPGVVGPQPGRPRRRADLRCHDEERGHAVPFPDQARQHRRPHHRQPRDRHRRLSRRLLRRELGRSPVQGRDLPRRERRVRGRRHRRDRSARESRRPASMPGRCPPGASTPATSRTSPSRMSASAASRRTSGR